VQDYKEAAKWFRLAAQQGHAKAQAFLGSLYWHGFGVEKDDVRVYMWINVASTSLSGNDLKIAMSLRDGILKILTSEQIAQAQEMARKCQASNFKNCD
jgi:hypothetical protein